MPRMVTPTSLAMRWGGVLQRGLGIDAEDGARLPLGRGPRCSMLQRGLGIDAEDGRREPLRLPRSLRASTGPRHRCRGWSLSRPHRRSPAPCFNGASASMPRMVKSEGLVGWSHWWLQRGLGIDAEDGSPFCCLAVCPVSFNGASASMPRMGREPLRLPRYPRALRGLGIDAEDGRLQTSCHEQRERASTGPRHRCRGWRRCPAESIRPAISLQRGLGIDAEDGR